MSVQVPTPAAARIPHGDSRFRPHIGFVDGFVNNWRSAAATTLTCDQVEGILTESVLALFEGNARSLGVPLERDTVVKDLLSRTETISSQ
ncbi:hypothetical protein ACQP2U_17460 [Nocardia sp. CA-084685]|uniref:hypothetical protein n=1 Tax=Nocardia sp. CA-084685 TaxID=3239970 RepID=UPI003D97C95C